jgi:D-erythrulose 4-kinase
MTRLFNEPDDFPLELIEGFTAAYPDFLFAVPGGVVRSTPYEEVAIVVGGGVGHYPAFCGLVGDGLAHGAAMGNIFSSPSAQQVHSVGKAAERGHGVIFTFGNYAGDVLHFGEAAERLSAEGIPSDCVLVTDDIASAPADQAHKRRGIAGDLTVFKTLGAAAREGYNFAESIRVGRHANERTRTLGVAFAGCTLPGESEPLFTVPDGMMSIGLGIHGEPGIEDVRVPTAEGLAEILVDRLLGERPAGAGSRVALLLNGLGTVKYEELFVVYRSVVRLVSEAGLEIVSPDVGELCTSLDMAGVSLTFFWLDDELERLWTSPSWTPAYRKGAATSTPPMSPEEISSIRARTAEEAVIIAAGSPASQVAAAIATDALGKVAALLKSEAAELGRLDAVAGDGDHGIGMERGARAAYEAAVAARDEHGGAGAVLIAAGHAWSDVAGGTSGALWGAAIRAIGAVLGDTQAVTASSLAAAVEAGRAAIQNKGGAVVGDKTMVDALVPYAAAVASLSVEDQQQWRDAAAVASMAAAATSGLTPRLGRARPLAAKSVGTPDPGAISLALIVQTVTTQLTKGSNA